MVVVEVSPVAPGEEATVRIADADAELGTPGLAREHREDAPIAEIGGSDQPGGIEALAGARLGAEDAAAGEQRAADREEAGGERSEAGGQAAAEAVDGVEHLGMDRHRRAEAMVEG